MLQKGMESLTNTMYMIWWYWIPFAVIESKYLILLNYSYFQFLPFGNCKFVALLQNSKFIAIRIVYYSDQTHLLVTRHIIKYFKSNRKLTLSGSH